MVLAFGGISSALIPAVPLAKYGVDQSSSRAVQRASSQSAACRRVVNTSVIRQAQAVQPEIGTAFQQTHIPGVELSEDKQWVRMFHIVMPQETDYSSNIWHGRYVDLLEEIRVHALEVILGVNYGELVRETETELVVHELNVTYVKPASMGEKLWVYCSVVRRGIRMVVYGHMDGADDSTVRAKSVVNLVPISTKTKKPLRRWPSSFDCIKEEPR